MMPSVTDVWKLLWPRQFISNYRPYYWSYFFPSIHIQWVNVTRFLFCLIVLFRHRIIYKTWMEWLWSESLSFNIISFLIQIQNSERHKLITHICPPAYSPLLTLKRDILGIHSYLLSISPNFLLLPLFWLASSSNFPYNPFLSCQPLHYPREPDSVAWRWRLYIPSKCQNTNLLHGTKTPKEDHQLHTRMSVVSTDHSSA